MTADGRIGIGTASPDAKLHVADAGQPIRVKIGSQTSGGTLLEIQTTAATGCSMELLSVARHNEAWGNLLLNTLGGNVGIGTANLQSTLEVNGTTRTVTLELTSDRAAKTGLDPVDAQAVLAKVAGLSITFWSYTNAPGVRHLGPTAQDFLEAFAVGASDQHISVVDGLGVALAAIQGVNQKLEAELKAKDARIAELEAQVKSLRSDVLARLSSLESQVASSAAGSAGAGGGAIAGLGLG